MKAAQYTSRGTVDLVDVPMPEASNDQLLLRTEKVTLCGSDLHYLHDSPDDQYPLPPGQSGHECVARVEASPVPSFRAGDRLLVLPTTFNAFAEYIVDRPEVCIPLPDGLSFEQGVLGQQLGTVVFCCRKLRNVLDKVVVVVGQGPAGILFTSLLYHMGARAVIGLDLVDHRLAVARQMGAAHTINVQAADPVEAVRELTNGKLADVVVEAVGKSETINVCARLIRQEGEVAIFGVPKQGILPVAMEGFQRQNARIITSVGAQAEPGLRSFRLGLDLIAQGRLDLSPLITHRLPFTRVRDAFDLAETKKDNALKVLLTFH